MTGGEDIAMESEPEDAENECQMEPTDLNVRVGPRDNPTRKEREDHILHGE